MSVHSCGIRPFNGARKLQNAQFSNEGGCHILRDRRNLVGTEVALKLLDIILADIIANFDFGQVQGLVVFSMPPMDHFFMESVCAICLIERWDWRCTHHGIRRNLADGNPHQIAGAVIGKGRTCPISRQLTNCSSTVRGSIARAQKQLSMMRCRTLTMANYIWSTARRKA